MSTKTRLGIMMFLQYAIWGAWAPVLSEYLMRELHFTGVQVGWIYAVLPLATIVAPFLGGQVADRWLASEKVIALLQLAGGVVLLVMSRITSYATLLPLMLFYCLLYAPTLAITNSLAMINLESSEKEFGRIRVWGTIGWIAAGWQPCHEQRRDRSVASPPRPSATPARRLAACRLALRRAERDAARRYPVSGRHLLSDHGPAGL